MRKGSAGFFVLAVLGGGLDVCATQHTGTRIVAVQKIREITCLIRISTPWPPRTARISSFVG